MKTNAKEKHELILKKMDEEFEKDEQFKKMGSKANDLSENALVTAFNTILCKKIDKKLQERGSKLSMFKLIHSSSKIPNINEDIKELPEVEHEVYMEWLGFDPFEEYREKSGKEKTLPTPVEQPTSFPGSIELTRKQKIYPRLEPVEKNLIDISLWYPTTKGLSKQNLEVKTCILTKNKNFIIEYDYELSLPTVFTFEITGVLFGIWQDQGYPPTFFTSLGEICRRKGIPSSQKNRENVLKALRQLHNTRISTPFWEKDKQGNRRKIRVWKINIVNIEAENITPGKNHTIELRINKYIAGNIIQKHFALLDYKLLGQLRSRIAKRLYSIIIQYPIPYQRNLPDLKELLNLRDTHANQTIRKASQALVNIGFLDHYTIKRSKRTKKLIYKAWRSNQRTLKPQSKDTKTAISRFLAYL